MSLVGLAGAGLGVAACAQSPGAAPTPMAGMDMGMTTPAGNAAEQVTKGLMGAFIIAPADKSREPVVDGDYTIVLNDTGTGLTLNRRSFPCTQPIVAQRAQTVRIRYMNEGLLIHPMFLPGLPQTVIAKDGWPVPQPWQCNTLNIAPGERRDVVMMCDEPGAWAFHCHARSVTHAESAHGRFGMVTALIVQ